MNIREGQQIITKTLDWAERRREIAKTHTFSEINPQEFTELQDYNISTYKWYVCPNCGVFAYARWISEHNRWTDELFPLEVASCRDKVVKDIIE